MILDTLQQLGDIGCRLKEYRYVGMGSIYFVDFMLMHRLFGMRKLLSVELDTTAERRVRFNNPFADVKIRIGSIGDALPTLDRDERHVVWLDYDHRLTTTDIEDLLLAAQVLSKQSIVMMTTDVEPPSDGSGPNEWMARYKEVAGDFLPFDITLEDFRRSSLAHTNARILANVIRQGVVARPNVSFLPMFSFAYADGHEMLTVGGMIGDADDERKLYSTGASAEEFIRKSLDDPPYVIEVPRLTRKERIALDQHMPCADGWVPKEFEITAEEIRNYRSIYRYYPMYGELMI